VDHCKVIQIDPKKNLCWLFCVWACARSLQADTEFLNWDALAASESSSKLTQRYFDGVQSRKGDSQQPSLAAVLPPWDPDKGTVEVCVVGCGPAGLALAAELAALGVDVGLVGAFFFFTLAFALSALIGQNDC
jgi:FAD binding domain